VEIRKLTTFSIKDTIIQRLNVYPFRNSQHKLKTLDFLGSATSSQMKDFMEAAPIVLRELYALDEHCNCRGVTCHESRPLNSTIRRWFNLPSIHSKWDHYCCLTEVTFVNISTN
jgi:hypothetical protein